MYKPAMHPIIRLAFLVTPVVVAVGGTLKAQQPSSVRTNADSGLASVQLARLPTELPSGAASVREIATSVAEIQASVNAADDRLSKLATELDARVIEDTKFLSANPSIEILYRIKLSWRDFGDNLAASDRDLTQLATRLEEKADRLDRLAQTWQAMLQSATEQGAPSLALQSIRSLMSSIERAQNTAEASRQRLFTLTSRLSELETKVRDILSLVEEARVRALKDLLVRDSPPIWSVQTVLKWEWENQSAGSFASQLAASSAFAKRLPYTFLIHVVFIVVIASTLQWLRRRLRNLAKDKSHFERAMPVLDLPISTAFVLSILFSASIYPQAPRLFQAILEIAALIPATLILRRLVDRNLVPILYALVITYFVDQLRILAAPLPGLARVLFLGQLFGVSLFLLWLLRSRNLQTQTSVGLSQAIAVITRIGLIVLPTAFVAGVLGYVNLANLLCMGFLRSVYVAALLYTGVRVLEGLSIILLQLPPLGSLRVVKLHRPMIQLHLCRIIAFLASLMWLNIMLNFFGLLTPLLATLQRALDASIAIGSLDISLGNVLIFGISIWASFLISKFVRFLLEEDVYQHFLLPSGIPYAISTVLHYIILVFGFFIALGALGIDLTKITILAGAFSVGVGFGLQNVINNFVSGLILLFERPIKLGDMIEIGGNGGTVSRIGIRASIVRTPSGSEVHCPERLTHFQSGDQLDAFGSKARS
jgi:potassium-dependent mechanosensitive channel